MRRTLSLLISSFCVSVLFPLTTSGQIGGSAGHPFFNAQISVQVRMANNTSAPQGVLVELVAEDQSPVDQAFTDTSGRCRFVPPAPTIYYVTAKFPGFQSIPQRIDLQNAQTGMANLVLRAIPGAAPPTASKEGTGVTSASDLAVPDGARKEFEKGQKSLTDKDLDGGISHLKKAIEIYPSFPQALTLLGTAYNEKKNWKDAQGALEKATTIDPKNASAFFQLGAALNQTKDYPGAQKALSQGLTLAPDAPEASAAQYELARAYMAQNNWKEAEPYAAKVVASQPDFGAGHLLMGNIFLKKGDGNGAIHEFQEYLRIDPKGPAADQIKDMIPKIQAAMKTQS
jgi:tetratricopeptide (TPR) repeat protein